MKNYRQEYIELHSLDFDIQNSQCGECQFVNDCQHYYGKCPQQVGKTLVTNAYSGSMVRSEEYSTKVQKISEDEFMDNAKKALSHVGNRGIANRYGLRFNRSPIRLTPGDEVYVVYIHGGVLPESGVLPANVSLSFEHIEVRA